MVSFFFEDVEIPNLDETKISSWLESVISDEKKTCGEISIIFCNDDYLLEINRNYLNHDYYTDVITFDYSEMSFVSGDIFISIDTVADNAKHFEVSFVQELHRIMVHGTLHLLGYADKTDSDKAIMAAKEDACLSKLKL